MSRPLAAVTAEEARRVDTVVFDLDDTLLDHGALTLDAFRALHALRTAGLAAVAATGRPSGFAEIAVRQWPITAAIAENGAVAWTRDESGRVAVDDPLGEDERATRRSALLEIAREVCAEHAGIALADDNWARRTDVALDVGERARVPADVVRRVQDAVVARGARTFASSIHVHLTLEAYDKASGFAAFVRRRGRDPVRALRTAAFVGDSANDASGFASFGLTFGVSNVRGHLRRLTIPPRYVASAPMGAGFAEITDRLLALRRGAT